MKKVYKKIDRGDGCGSLTIYGSNRNIKLFYAVPEWSRESGDAKEYFNYHGKRYYLSEFMRIENYAPEWMKEFDGYAGDSFFSGVLIKLSECDMDDCVKAYTYIG
jgi:hypothetical protein